MILLAIFMLLYPTPPLQFDLITQTHANFSTPAPCLNGLSEPVIAVYYADYDYDYEDAWFVGGVDGCHYQLTFSETKPVTMMCLAWPNVDIAGIWLHAWDERTELWCWMPPKNTIWLPKT